MRLPSGYFHNMDCAIQYANNKKKKPSKKSIAAKRKAEKESIKTKAQWLSQLQSLVNQYIRLKDAKDGCISCDKPSTWGGQYHAGHFFSRGHSSALRFNLWNIHKQCSVCNNHLSGNIGKYTPRLIDKIGQERFDYLETHSGDVSRYEVEWIKRAIKITRKALKRKIYHD